MTYPCEECGAPAKFIIERRCQIFDIDTGCVRDHPEDAYERELMTDCLCENCYKEAGYEQ